MSYPVSIKIKYFRQSCTFEAKSEKSGEGILRETNENFRKILSYVGVRKKNQKSSLLSEYYTQEKKKSKFF